MLYCRCFRQTCCGSVFLNQYFCYVEEEAVATKILQSIAFEIHCYPSTTFFKDIRPNNPCLRNSTPHGHLSTVKHSDAVLVCCLLPNSDSILLVNRAIHMKISFEERLSNVYALRKTPYFQ